MHSLLEDVFETNVSDLDSYIKLLQSKGINTEELQPILESEGKTLLVATAGAGKSSALAYLYAKDKLLGILGSNKPEQHKGKIALVTTFLKTGSEDLEHNIQKTLGDLELFDITTSNTSFKNLHSEFRQLLVLAGVNLTNKEKPGYVSLLSDFDTDKRGLRTRLLKKLFRDFSLGKSPEYPTNIELNTLEGIISRYRNTVVTEFSFADQERDAKDLNLRLSMMPTIVEEFSKMRARNNVIDFDDMLEKVYTYFSNPETRNPRLYELFVNRYYYLMLDEAQDMSELQYETLKPIFETCERVVVVGDPDQSIYGFRGANPDVMRWFERDFSPNVLPLSVSYRCPTNILNPIAKSIRFNSNRFDTDIRAFREGGSVQALEFVDLVSMVRATVNKIEEALIAGKTVTIVSRTNFTYSPAMIGWAIHKGSGFNLYGDAYTLDRPKYKRIWSLLELVRGRGLKNLRSNLRVLEPEFPAYVAKQVEDIMMNNVPENGNILGYLDWITDNYNSRSLTYLQDKLKDIDLSTGFGQLSAFKILLNHVKFYGKSNDAEVVDTLLTLVSESETPEEFMTNMDFVNSAIKDSTSNKKAVSPLSFSTTHGYKGKQADVMIGFNVSEDVFPSPLSGKDNFEEERRNFFILGTRAIEEMYYFCLVDKASPFLKETELPIVRVSLVEDSSVIKTNSQSLKERMQEVVNPADDLDDLDLSDFL